MKFIRPIQSTDLPALMQMAQESGPGFTSLQPCRQTLEDKVERACLSLAESPEKRPEMPLYLLMLEDSDTGEICGVSGIEAKVGGQKPMYHFKQSNGTALHSIQMQRHYQDVSEICSLFVRPDFRSGANGKLLSKTRFLFMADFPEVFSETVIAEMRGYIDAMEQSPFFRWLQALFLPLSFKQVDSLMGKGQTRFIQDLMPQFPLLLSALPNEARACLGRVHPKTEPALAMLQQEGFVNRGLFDLFDAGPTVECQVAALASVKESHCGPCDIAPVQGNERLIISNRRFADFRAVATTEAKWCEDAKQVTLAPEVAQCLQVEAGDSLRIRRC